MQIDMFGSNRAPQMIAYGCGVDSTAMTIEMFARGDQIDQILFADTGSEKRTTYEYLVIFERWARDRCIERIEEEVLPVPPKSACVMCTATKPHELREFDKSDLRLIVLMEARAAPRLRTTEGLWRKAVKGTKRGTARPGSMTEFIRSECLLDPDEIAD